MSVMCRKCGQESDLSFDVCPQCGARLDVNDRIPSVGKNRTPSRYRLLSRIGMVAILAVGITSYFRDAFREYHPIIALQPQVSQVSGISERINSTMVDVKIVGSFFILSLNELREKHIVRFVDPEKKQMFPVIAYLTPSGRLVTAISVSENCRSTDFYLEGENIHCANCPSYWNAASMEAYACCQKYYPDPIPSTILGDEVRIETAKVRNWKARS